MLNALVQELLYWEVVKESTEVERHEVCYA